MKRGVKSGVKDGCEERREGRCEGFWGAARTPTSRPPPAMLSCMNDLERMCHAATRMRYHYHHGCDTRTIAACVRGLQGSRERWTAPTSARRIADRYILVLKGLIATFRRLGAHMLSQHLGRTATPACSRGRALCARLMVTPLKP